VEASVARQTSAFKIQIMPIEIKELLIRASVGSQANERPRENAPVANLENLKQEIIEEVTEEVLRKLMLKNER
jgi:hypothetical protein